MAGSLSLPQFGALVAKPSRQMSANYAIAKDGSIGAFCDEDNDGAFAVVYKRTDGGYGLIVDSKD